MQTSGAVLPDAHAASLLGRETEPPITMPRPGFRHFPGPVVCAVLFVPFAALAAFGFLTFRAQLSPGFYWFVAAGAGFLLLGCLGSTWWWLRLGLTISLRDLGMTLVARGRQHSIRYADIEALTIADTRRYDERRAVVAFNRTISIDAHGRTARAKYIALPNDVLDPLLDRLVARIAQEARPWQGEGWSIERATLRWRGSDIPLQVIARAGVFDGHVRLWRRSEEMHFASVPLSSRNAHLLLVLAERGAAGSQPAEISADADPSALGMLLFTRRTSITSVLFNLALAIAALWVGTIVVARLLPPELHDVGRGAIFGLGVLAVLHATYRITMRYRFHERGVVRTTIAGSRSLLYRNIGAMTWKETTTLIEGAVATGTNVVATLVPADGGKALVLRLHRFRADDSDIAPLRQSLARHIAVHLREHLGREGRVAWTKNATFTAAGIEVKTGLFGGNTELLPYDQPIGAHFTNGFLHLYRENRKKPIAVLEASADNFYPCFALFEMLMQRVVMAEEKTA